MVVFTLVPRVFVFLEVVSRVYFFLREIGPRLLFGTYLIFNHILSFQFYI